METTELLKKIRKIEIKTKGLSKDIFSGDYHSSFKGRGMAFSEVREYSFGDDIRAIDWNVTARSNQTHIKIFEEERELTVILLVDMSASESFGTDVRFKRELIVELCAVISFSAMQNNDKIGVIFFSDKVEKFIPPKKGKKHILRIISELLEFKPESKKTDVGVALKYLTNTVKKRAIVFVMSDFMDKGYSDVMKIAAKKHDTILVQIYDKLEAELPNVGLINVRDLENGNELLLDTSSKKIREIYRNNWLSYQNYLAESSKKSKLDVIQIQTKDNYILPLRAFFKKREKRK